MKQRSKAVLPVSLAALLLLSWPIRSAAHEGHDHGAPPPPVSATVAPRADASSNDFEIVLVARGGELVIYLDAFATNAPIEGATLEIDSPAGVLKPVARGAGVYAVPAPFAARPGSYDLAVTITAGDTVDILPATLRIPEAAPSTAAAPPTSWLTTSAIAEEVRRRLGSASSPWAPLLLGFLAGAGLVALLRRRADRRVSAGAVALAVLLTAGDVRAENARPVVVRDIAQRLADGALFVPKPTQHILAIRTLMTRELDHPRTAELPGRVVPDPNASGLVQATVGGRLSPPPGGFKALGTTVKTGDILAFVRPPLALADATTQQQQARELDQQISIITRKIERLKAIERVIARSQLEDAELELEGLRTRRANLDRVQREAEPLLAPVDGIIAATNAVTGQVVGPSAVIFQIIDPKRLWIEALSYDALVLSGAARAVLADGRSIALDYLGTGFADRNQAVPIQFAVRDAAGLRAGQFVTVLATLKERRRGIAVPREAVIRGANGQSIVFEHTNAERFVPREVRVEPLDGTLVVIVAGLAPGRRVVTQGAELLNQIR